MTSGVILPVTPEKRPWFHEFNMVQQVFVRREVPMQRDGKLQMLCNNSTVMSCKDNMGYNMLVTWICERCFTQAALRLD